MVRQGSDGQSDDERERNDDDDDRDAYDDDRPLLFFRPPLCVPRNAMGGAKGTTTIAMMTTKSFPPWSLRTSIGWS